MPVQPPTIVEIRAKMLLFQSKHKLDFTPMGIDSRCYKFFNAFFLCILLARGFFKTGDPKMTFLKWTVQQKIPDAPSQSTSCNSRILSWNTCLWLLSLTFAGWLRFDFISSFFSLCRGKVVLGYSETEICMKGSGYQFIHAADMMYCADSHLRSMLAIYSHYLVFDRNAHCLSCLELFSHYKGSPMKNIWSIFTSFMRCY